MKIEAILNWPTPKTVSNLRGFLGLSGYYRKYVRHYAQIAKPLHDLLKKGDIEWNVEADEAFKALKQAMVLPPVLAVPDFSKLFVIETDASSQEIDAVLI